MIKKGIKNSIGNLRNSINSHLTNSEKSAIKNLIMSCKNSKNGITKRAEMKKTLVVRRVTSNGFMNSGDRAQIDKKNVFEEACRTKDGLQ